MPSSPSATGRLARFDRLGEQGIAHDCRMKYLLIFMALFAGAVLYVMTDGGAAGGFSSGSPAFMSSFDSTMSSAKTSGKPAVLIFSAHWCPPCQMMKKEVYPSAEVAPFKDRFVWAYLDVDQPGTRAAAEKFQVRGIPAIFIVSPDGKQLGQQVGGSDPATFARLLASAAGR
jgi:thioredoxin 1